MTKLSSSLTVAVVQAAPIPLDFAAGIDKAVRLAREAIDSGARVLAFGETFLGGYPLWLDEAPGAALWDHPGTKALHAIMLEQAVVANDERLLPLQELADASGAAISIGAHERVRRSLVNNQLTFRPGLPVLDHRKLVPTHGERLIWARGDGSTLGVHQAEWGRLGQPDLLGALDAARPRSDAQSGRGCARRGLADGAREPPDCLTPLRDGGAVLRAGGGAGAEERRTARRAGARRRQCRCQGAARGDPRRGPQPRRLR